jgi:hypothetical protein
MSRFVVIAVSCATLVSSALAHHSAAVIYDIDATIALKGTITNVELMNPHVRFFIDFEDADGDVANSKEFLALTTKPIFGVGL